MSPILILGIVFLLIAAFFGWQMLRIGKVVKVQRRFDGHDHAKVLKVCKKEHIPGAMANAAGVGALSGMTSPGDDYVVVAFDPEPRVHIETTTSFGMPNGFFEGVETVEIQYDLNNPTKIYLCDERPIIKKQSMFTNIAVVFGVIGILLVMMGL